jgi:hypothetical protein
MVSNLRGASALLVLLVASGCALNPYERRQPDGLAGIVFTYSTRPLTTNFHATPVVPDGGGAGSVFQVQYYVRILWGDNSIGGLAKEAGFDEVYYADITTFSIWTYFKMQRVRVYGHRPGTPPVKPAHELDVKPEP